MRPRGFTYSVAEAAIKKPGRNDLALIFSETDANMAGVFTKNRVKAAPVRLCSKRIRSGKGRAIIINSGNANACTGDQGLRDAEETSTLVSRHFGIPDNHVYVCSTGVISVPLPMKRIKPALKSLHRDIGKAGLEEVARAVMTTDTFPKFLIRKVRIGSRTGTIAGVCKGGGMIAPNMATTLCFIMTDIAVEKKALKTALKDSLEDSFNSITVDGDMSTNDMVLAMANGAIGNPEITVRSKHYAGFARIMSEMMQDLSKMVVRDGEGSTKVIEVDVKGAKTKSDARKCAFAIANSLLVKTAVYGNDPNVGRIMAAAGYSGAAVDDKKTDVYLGKVRVIRNGISTGLEARAKKELNRKEVKLTVDLKLGRAGAHVLTCDLTEEYVKINAEYTT
jgi:glutamate N-acetyltransferase/amino-acid N-acetyltransferase